MSRSQTRLLLVLLCLPLSSQPPHITSPSTQQLPSASLTVSFSFPNHRHFMITPSTRRFPGFSKPSSSPSQFHYSSNLRPAVSKLPPRRFCPRIIIGLIRVISVMAPRAQAPAIASRSRNAPPTLSRPCCLRCSKNLVKEPALTCVKHNNRRVCDRCRGKNKPCKDVRRFTPPCCLS